MLQGPLQLSTGGRRGLRIENGSFTASNVPTLERLRLWKRARISVEGRPDWIFVKVHCHGMDPTQELSVLGTPMRELLRRLVEGAAERNEVPHFVSAREMTNIILAACDGREGNPGDYRDYRLKRAGDIPAQAGQERASQLIVKG